VSREVFGDRIYQARVTCALQEAKAAWEAMVVEHSEFCGGCDECEGRTGHAYIAALTETLLDREQDIEGMNQMLREWQREATAARAEAESLARGLSETIEQRNAAERERNDLRAVLASKAWNVPVEMVAPQIKAEREPTP
jgi:predicted alpha-1,6-mannanase (GH76 family)